MKNFFLVLISTFFVFSCTATTNMGSGNTGKAISVKDIANTSWKLTDISGEKVIPKKIDGKEIGAVTLDITADKISGSAGVNRYFGSYDVNGTEVTINGVGSTKMMGPDDLMKTEYKYLSVLQDVTSVELKDKNTLILKSDSDTLTFTKTK
ncbi:MAG: META domain-containing protein [Sebaldella sp.]|nr:META domain-containing protein [Sebaldella sp.]